MAMLYRQGKRCKMCKKIKVMLINVEVCEDCQRMVRDLNEVAYERYS